MSETDRLLNEIKMYLRISAAYASRSKAATILDTQEKAMVYEKLDGTTTQQTIADLTKVPRQTVTRWADEFVRAGLASAPDKYQSTHRALFSLAELGIDMNILKKRARGGPAPSSSPATSTLDGNQSGGEGESPK